MIFPFCFCFYWTHLSMISFPYTYPPYTHVSISFLFWCRRLIWNKILHKDTTHLCDPVTCFEYLSKRNFYFHSGKRKVKGIKCKRMLFFFVVVVVDFSFKICLYVCDGFKPEKWTWTFRMQKEIGEIGAPYKCSLF